MSKGMKRFIGITVIIGLVVSLVSVIAVGQIVPNMIDNHAVYMTKQIELAKKAGVITSEEADFYISAIDEAKQYYLEEGGFFKHNNSCHNELKFLRGNNLSCSGEDCYRMEGMTDKIILTINEKVKAGELTVQEADSIISQLRENRKQFDNYKNNSFCGSSYCEKQG